MADRWFNRFFMISMGLMILVLVAVLALVLAMAWDVVSRRRPSPDAAIGCTHKIVHRLELVYEDSTGALIGDHDRSFWVPRGSDGLFVDGWTAAVQILRREKLDAADAARRGDRPRSAGHDGSNSCCYDGSFWHLIPA